MKRMIASLKNDVTIQVRNQLYGIGIAFALLGAFIVMQVFPTDYFGSVIPVVMLFIVGGSTLLYVAGMIVFEKDEGTLNALIVSPLSTGEYLLSKIITLTLLATLESLILVGIATQFRDMNPFILIAGVISIGVMYTLIGIILIVRFKSITDFLVPVLVLALVLQLPFVHFLNLITNPLFLVIPTSAPTLLMQGAWRSLETWEWLYGIGYSVLIISGLIVWSLQAFKTHIIMKVG